MSSAARKPKPEDFRLRLGHFYKMAELLTPGKAGNVELDTFEITPTTFQGFFVEQTRPGIYARLKVNGDVMMSDTDMELRTNIDAVLDARGDVLIGGLGLGAILLPILAKPAVTSVTVVELNPHVITLVEPSIRGWIGRSAQTGQRFALKLRSIERGDIATWRPEIVGRSKRCFDYIYIDIWQDLCTDNVEGMQALHKAWRPYLRRGGKVTSWEYDRLRYLKRQGRWR